MADSGDSKPVITSPTPQDSNAVITTDANGEEAPKATQEPGPADVVMRKEQENGLLDTKIPAKKDATLREFLSKMDEHAPIVSIPVHTTRD
jgi:hypothetical protein